MTVAGTPEHKSTEDSQSQVPGVLPGELQPCFWCGADERAPLSTRADGVAILECITCGHRAVSRITLDLDSIYADSAYFNSALQSGSQEIGYKDYQSIAIGEWNAELFSALMLVEGSSSPSILDVGCASGTFLDFCKPFGVATFGIEPSPWATRVCSEKGHQIVARTLDDFQPADGRYQLITAFHVLEHLTQPRESLKKLSEVAATTSSLLAVFPRVDFLRKAGWSGQNDSFEHVSYFDVDFVRRAFGQCLGGSFSILHGPDLLYLFAGHIPSSAQAAIALVEELTASGAALDIQDLDSRLPTLTPTSFLFAVCFVARNHSADRAREMVECAERLGLFDADHRSLAQAFVRFQNRNPYGAMSSVEHVSNAHPGLAMCKKSLQAQIPELLTRMSETGYPLVSVVAVCGRGRPITDDFVESIGLQTYPCLELIHVHEGSDHGCNINPELSRLIKTVDVSGLPDGEAMRRTQDSLKGEWVMWTDASLRLSPYCVFALYEPMKNRTDSAAYPTVDDGKTEINRTGSSFWQRLMERLNFTPPPLVMISRSTFDDVNVHPSTVRDTTKLAGSFGPIRHWRCRDVLASSSSSGVVNT